MKSIGFYHAADLDGKCCGAILKKEVPDITLYAINHGDPFPWNIIGSHDTVYMCDFSLSDIAEMHGIYNLSGTFIWIDHHASAIQKYADYRYDLYKNTGIKLDLKGIREVGRAACELTWEYFHPNEAVPRAITLLGAYDTWRQNEKDFSWKDEILPFQYGMQAEDNSPDGNIWHSIIRGKELKTIYQYIIDNGTTILSYLNVKNKENALRNSYEAIFEGLTAICINSESHSSSVLDSIYDPNKHALMIVYTHQKDSWYVSLYTTHDNIDCSVLAQKYKGGGHKKSIWIQYIKYSETSMECDLNVAI